MLEQGTENLTWDGGGDAVLKSFFFFIASRLTAAKRFVAAHGLRALAAQKSSSLPEVT